MLAAIIVVIIVILGTLSCSIVLADIGATPEEQEMLDREQEEYLEKWAKTRKTRGKK